MRHRRLQGWSSWVVVLDWTVILHYDGPHCCGCWPYCACVALQCASTMFIQRIMTTYFTLSWAYLLWPLWPWFFLLHFSLIIILNRRTQRFYEQRSKMYTIYIWCFSKIIRISSNEDDNPVPTGPQNHVNLTQNGYQSPRQKYFNWYFAHIIWQISISNQINFIADNVKYFILQQQIIHNNTKV